MARPKNTNQKRRKAANGTGSVRKTKSGKYEARYTAIVDVTSGKKVKKANALILNKKREFFWLI